MECFMFVVIYYKCIQVLCETEVHLHLASCPHMQLMRGLWHLYLSLANPDFFFEVNNLPMMCQRTAWSVVGL